MEKLHSTHKGQKIRPILLYKEAIKEHVKEENYDDFILKELNNPDKYISDKKEDIFSITRSSVNNQIRIKNEEND